MPSKKWDEITYFPDFKGCTADVWEWIINIIPYFVMDVITSSIFCRDNKNIRYIQQNFTNWCESEQVQTIKS